MGGVTRTRQGSREGIVLAQAAQQLGADHVALLAAAAQHIAVLLCPPTDTQIVHFTVWTPRENKRLGASTKELSSATI